uniref:Uncharacterized protein n=1 Tax=viral metagenome TaxID=1070528 RepID=A0A6M3KJD1_9ZZZZ
MRKYLLAILLVLLMSSNGYAAQGWTSLGDATLGAGMIYYNGGGGFSIATDGSDYLSSTRIDDTKGNGDTGYTYSADKVYDENVKTRGLHEAIAANTDPFTITPTGGWTAAMRFDFWITDTTDGGDIALSETGPPADGTLAVLHNASSNTIEIPNSDGNLEIPNDGTVVLEVYESYAVVYRTDRWVPLNDKSTANYATLTTVETEFIPVGWMIDGASAPDASATFTSGTEKVDARTFAGDADEDLVFYWNIPLDLDTTSGVKFLVNCIVTSATGPSSETWQFELQGCSLGSGDALDCTLGTAQTSNSGSRTDAQYDLVGTAYSAAMTSTHITDLAVGENAIFKLYRDVDDTDTYVQVVGVIGITLKYKRFHNATF